MEIGGGEDVKDGGAIPQICGVREGEEVRRLGDGEAVDEEWWKLDPVPRLGEGEAKVGSLVRVLNPCLRASEESGKDKPERGSWREWWRPAKRTVVDGFKSTCGEPTAII